MVGPSMTGSENGIPISTASAPADTMARSTSRQCSPSPPVTYVTSSLRPVSRAARSDVSTPTPVTTARFAVASPDQAHHLLVILVTTARHGDQHGRVLGQLAARGSPHHPCHRVGG